MTADPRCPCPASGITLGEMKLKRPAKSVGVETCLELAIPVIFEIEVLKPRALKEDGVSGTKHISPRSGVWKSGNGN